MQPLPGPVPLGELYPHQQLYWEEGVSCNNRAFRGLPSTLAARDERPLPVRTSRASCLICPAIIRENKFVSNNTGRNCFATDITLDEVHCKIQNYIYLLTCTHCGIQYAGESITPLNLRTTIHRRGKSGCEISNDHYRNVCKNAIFSIQVTEKLPGYGYENEIKDNAMFEY